MFHYIITLLLLFQLSSSDFPTESCGYGSCPTVKDGMINVHIVCHTHLDTGWVETYDEYFYRYVRGIYDSVVKSLFEAQDRRFIVVETSFFSRWYNEQNQTIQNRVHWLVRMGQLEFISGGWSMNDEAAAHYSGIIDNLTFGMKWLNLTFGQCGIPKIGWQIDPFGHSREQASIFSQMAFDGLFLGRIDYQDKIQRQRTREMEFVWKSSPSLGSKADLFTSVLPNIYWPPKGFCFDVNCYDELIYDSNAERRAREFIRLVKQQMQQYATNHTIITMGMDFYYRDANRWYTNLDRLMYAVNSLQSEEGVNVIYSTPSCYLKSLHDSNISWNTKHDDFFPYADAFNAYWTGYFTSRPSLKYLIKYGNNLLQAAKQLHVLSRMNNVFSVKFQQLQETLGILHHHDGVTGTCKQYVNDDYIRMLSKGIARVEEAISDSYHRLLLNEGYVSTSSQTFCHNLNISECSPTERIETGADVVMSIYNPLAHPVQHYMRLPVRNFRYRVRDVSGGIVPSQTVPINLRVLSLPSRNSISTSELVFQAILPPLGFSNFIIDRLNDYHYNAAVGSEESQSTEGNPTLEDITLNNGKIRVIIDGITGYLKSVTLKNGRTVPLSQNFFWYQGEDRYGGEKPSGAYAFNPTHNTPHATASSAVINKVIRGNLVEEVHQTFKPWITQVIRLYRDYEYIEFDWVIGPIPIKNWLYDYGQEIITRYDTTFQTNQTFFTDSNGRETIRRVRHYRPTWVLNATETVASNYYPITSWIFVRDYSQNLQLTVLTDRSQGGSSMSDGSLELMLHRRLLHDDGYGMDEALNEPGHDNNGLIVRGKHRLIVNGIHESVRQMRAMSKTFTWKSVPTFRRRVSQPNVGVRGHYYFTSHTSDNINFVGINNLLPKNVHLLTLEPWNGDNILLRLEHFYEINEDPDYSQPTEVSLRNLFTSFRIIGVQELTLSANQELDYALANRFRWTSSGDLPEHSNYYDNENSIINGNITSFNFNIILNPMEIKTLLVRVERRTNCPYNGFNVPRRRNHRVNNNNNSDC